MIKKQYLFITNQFKFGGVEKVFINISTLLQREIFILPLHLDFDEKILCQIPNNVTVLKLPFLFKRSITDLFLLRKVQKFIISKFSVSDLVVINFSDTLRTLLVTSLISDACRVSWIHCNPEVLKQSNHSYIYKKLYKKMDKIVCLCESQKKLFCEISSINQSKVSICYNYLNLSTIQSNKELALNVIQPFFVMVARIDFRSKDFYTPIYAFKKILQNSSVHIKLFFIGDGLDRHLVEKCIENENLSSNVVIYGLTDNPYNWMKNSNAVILSSKSEGYSMVVAEGLACGANIISSNCNCGPSDILENGKYGDLFNVSDVQELYNYMQQYLVKVDNCERNICRANDLNMKAICQLNSLVEELEK